MSLDALLPQPAAGGGIFPGEFSRDVADPDDLAFVVAYDFPREFGPCVWMPRGEVLPNAGDRCLIYVQPGGDTWVLAWTWQT